MLVPSKWLLGLESAFAGAGAGLERGRRQLTGGAVKACNDHRIAMSAAAASAGCSGDITVDDIKCIDKSYPEFLRDFAKVKAN